MLERDIALDFREIFDSYPLLVPTSMTESGWPDRLIQLPRSVIVACELKRVTLTRNGYFIIPHLKQEQCAWLAKWQRNGGLCFLFCGVLRDGSLLDYSCIVMKDWRDWLQANKQRYYISDVGLWNGEAVLMWFGEWTRSFALHMKAN